MNRMVLLILLILLGTPGLAQTQSGYDLYQKALIKERATGDVAKALRLYQRIVREFGSDRPLAAKAQLRLGLLYERLGRKTEAQQAFQAVLGHYSEQTEAARQAQARLAALARSGNLTGGGSAKTTSLTVRQVWAGAGVDPLGKPLPDGKAFVYTDWETGDIAIREFASGKARRLTNKGSWLQSAELGLTPVPAPDGKQVAYYWFNKDKVAELRISGLDGAPPRVLYHSAEVSSPTPVQWTPDGKQVLAIFTNKDSTNQLALVTLADGAARVLKSFGAYYPLKVSLSPDGRYIAYDLPPDEEATSTDIYLLAVADGRETPLEKHPANDYPLGWTPDGKRLLFASDRTGSLGAWLLPVANGQAQGAPALVKPDVGQIFPMEFAGAGAYYFGLRTGMQDVYTATMDWTAGKPMATPAPVSQQYMGANTSSD